MMRTFTSPVKPSPGDLIKASHMVNHARSIEELQRAYSEPIKRPNKPRPNNFEHMWQVTAAEEVDGNYTYNVKGGIVVVQGERVDVEEVLALAGGDVVEEGDTGFIYLRVFREESSRAYNPSIPPIIEWSSTSVESDYYDEMTILAEVKYGVITQCRNDEICSMELMIVANGEFLLIPVQANSRNSYDTPSL